MGGTKYLWGDQNFLRCSLPLYSNHQTPNCGLASQVSQKCTISWGVSCGGLSPKISTQKVCFCLEWPSWTNHTGEGGFGFGGKIKPPGTGLCVWGVGRANWHNLIAIACNFHKASCLSAYTRHPVVSNKIHQSIGKVGGRRQPGGRPVPGFHPLRFASVPG